MHLCYIHSFDHALHPPCSTAHCTHTHMHAFCVGRSGDNESLEKFRAVIYFNTSRDWEHEHIAIVSIENAIFKGLYCCCCILAQNSECPSRHRIKGTFVWVSSASLAAFFRLVFMFFFPVLLSFPLDFRRKKAPDAYLRVHMAMLMHLMHRTQMEMEIEYWLPLHIYGRTKKKLHNIQRQQRKNQMLKRKIKIDTNSTNKFDGESDRMNEYEKNGENKAEKKYSYCLFYLETLLYVNYICVPGSSCLFFGCFIFFFYFFRWCCCCWRLFFSSSVARFCCCSSCKWKHPWFSCMVFMRCRIEFMFMYMCVQLEHFGCRVGLFWYMCTTQTMILCVSLVNVLFMSYTHHPCHAHTIFCAENVQCRWNDIALLFSNFSVRSLGARWTDRRTIEIGAKLMRFAFSFHFSVWNKHTMIHMIYMGVCVYFSKIVLFCSQTTLTINKFRGEFSDLFISLTCYLHDAISTDQNILNGLQRGISKHETMCYSCRKKSILWM